MSKWQKITASALILVTGYAGSIQCFGKFPIIRKVYELNGRIGQKVDGGLLGRFISTLVMWAFLIVFVYAVSTLLDVLIFNLVEFWTGEALFLENGQSIFHADGSSLNSIENGRVLRLDTPGKESLYFFKDKPWQAFVMRNGNYVPLESHTDESGNAELSAGGEILARKQLTAVEMRALETKINGAVMTAMLKLNGSSSIAQAR